MSVGALIRKYLDDEYIEIGRTKRIVLRLASDCDIAAQNAVTLEAHQVIDHCKIRKTAGAGPETVSHDVSYLRTVLRSAKPLWGYPVDDAAIKEALLCCMK